jgi:hypothetical protein
MELEAMMVFISDEGANVMRRAPVWMMDSTFFTAPKPYYQVTMNLKKRAYEISNS